MRLISFKHKQVASFKKTMKGIKEKESLIKSISKLILISLKYSFLIKL